MRFLTREWLNSRGDPLMFLNREVYRRHLEDIESELPLGAKVFALMGNGLNLMNASIVSTRLDEEQKIFTLIVEVKGIDADHFLTLEYQGAPADRQEIEAFEMATHCLTEEFDLTPDGITEHRIMLMPDGEAVIRFTDLVFHAKRKGDK